jgi:hypothetical protein
LTSWLHKRGKLASTSINIFNFTTSWGDLADIFDGVSSDCEDELSSNPALREVDSKDVIDDEFGDTINTGIKKVDSYPYVCTKNFQ